MTAKTTLPDVDPGERARAPSARSLLGDRDPFPATSIYDNVARAETDPGTRGKQPRRRVVEKSLRGANLWEEVKDRPGPSGVGLSGGQQQRLCIARGATRGGTTRSC